MISNRLEHLDIEVFEIPNMPAATKNPLAYSVQRVSSPGRFIVFINTGATNHGETWQTLPVTIHSNPSEWNQVQPIEIRIFSINPL